MKLNINLYNDDCFNIFPQIKDKSIDAIICDPPYGSTAPKWDAILPFDKLWVEYKRIIKDNGIIILFAQQPFTSQLILSNLKMYRYNWYWDKIIGSGSLHVRFMPMKRFEDICVFYKKKPTYNPIMTPRDPSKIRKTGNFKNPNQTYFGMDEKKQYLYDPKWKYPDNLLQYHAKTGELNSKNRKHPHQKPVALLEYLIKTYTNEYDIILDNTMGVGSTGVAAKNLNRHFIGIEKVEKFYKIAYDRIFL